MSEKSEKLEHEKYVAEKKLTAARHREKQLHSQSKGLTRRGRTHRFCTCTAMLEPFLKDPALPTTPLWICRPGITLHCNPVPSHKFYKILLYFDDRIKYNPVFDSDI